MNIVFKTGLLKYCKLESFAMVMILAYLEHIAG
jgi:hypothetical protein